MKGYIIHLPKSQKSLDSALSIKLELESIGIEPHLFNGCDRYDVWQEFIDNEFTIQDITRFGGGYVDSEIATFISHYKLWKKCVDDNESIIIFEHDANIDLTFDINLLNTFDDDLLNLGKPNWGTRIWEGVGIKRREICNEYHNIHSFGEGCQCNRTWLFGAHAYLLTVNGANKLLKSVGEDGILPADLFLRQEVLNIYDLLPHPFSQKEEFSLIQRNAIYKNQKVNDWEY